MGDWSKLLERSREVRCDSADSSAGIVPVSMLSAMAREVRCDSADSSAGIVPVSPLLNEWLVGQKGWSALKWLL